MAPGSEKGGCLNCYAARMAARNLPEMRSPTTGAPFAIMRDSGPRWTGDVELIASKLEEPLHWRKPRRVFVNSMSDLFHDDLSREAILSVWDVMKRRPRHTFQILTKRAAGMKEAFETFLSDDPLPNVWLGVSVEDQATADARIPLLLQTPAALRFVSYEPALGPANFKAAIMLKFIDWVIVGGESGPRARPFDLAWARSARDQCAAAGVPFFLKQLGAVPVMNEDEWRSLRSTPLLNHRNCKHAPDGSGVVPLYLRSRKGGDPSEWPEDLRDCRAFPRR
jgi:protein gp37